MGFFDDVLGPEPDHPMTQKIIGVESAGDPNAKNPRSSAEGLGQFIDSTFEQFLQEQRPELVGSNLSSLKRDPKLSREATNWYARKNEDYLGSKGLPTDPGAVYLAHFAGPAGAENLFRASPEASAADVLGAKAVRDNPFLAGMSAGDVQNWARQKMGAEGSETQVAQGYFDDVLGPMPEQEQPTTGYFDDVLGPLNEVAPGLPPSGQQELPLVGGETAGGEAPAGEGPGQPSPVVQASPKEGEEPSLFDGLNAPGFWQQSVVNTLKATTMTKINTGKLTPQEGARELLALNERETNIERRERFKEDLRASKRPEYQGWKGALKRVFDYPDVALERMGESAAYMAIGAGGVATGAAIGGMVGGPPGAALGGFGGGFTAAAVQETASIMLEALEKEGIDVTSEESLAGAYANTELWDKVRTYARTKAAPIALLEGLATFVGMKGGGRAIMGQLEKTFGKEVVEKTAKREAVEEGMALMLAVEAPAGAGGEALSSAVVGEPIDPYSVMLEGFGEIALGGPQVALEVAIAREGRETAAADAERIKQVTTAITDIPSYEEAEVEGRKWFGFVDQGYEQERGWDPIRKTQVFTDYETAERLMGKDDPRSGRLVAAGENDITATSTDAVRQVNDTTNPAAPRFVEPATEQRARELWDAFVASKDKEDYHAATREGLRLAPRDQKAEFVGDMGAAEILPKSELVLDPSMVTVRGTSTSTGVPKQELVHNKDPLNMLSLLQDKDFYVYLGPKGFKTFADGPRKETRAAAVFELNDHALEARVQTGGWAGLIDDFAQMTDADVQQQFRDGKIKLRPSMSWNTRLPGFGDIGVTSLLKPKEAKVALARHKTSFPTFIPGTSITDQTPELGSPLARGRIDMSPKTPVLPGKVSLHFGSTSNPDYEKTILSWVGIAEKIMATLGIKNRLIVVAARGSDVAFMQGQFDGGGFATFNAHAQPGGGFMMKTEQGDVILFLPPSWRGDNVYQTRLWGHEFGHTLAYWALSELPAKHQAQIYAAYRRYMLTYKSGDNITHYVQRGLSWAERENATTSGQPDYYKTFEEWFGEQVARWSVTSAKPVGHVAKFFRALGKKIVYAYKQFRRLEKIPAGESLKAEPIIQEWLDALYVGNANWSVGVRETLVETTRAANAKHGVNIPLQAESVKTDQVLTNPSMSPNAAAGPNAGTPSNHTPGALRAQLDKFNWLMKWGYSYRQVAQENMHIPEVLLYEEGLGMSRLEVNNIMADAERILKQFMRPLRGQKTAGKTQSVRLADFLFDMTEMNYRTTDEVNKKVRRNPTAAEFQALVSKHKLSNEAVTTYEQMRDFFVKAVLRGEEVAIAEAQHVFANNPAQMQIQIATAKMMTRRILNAPYFPMTRFGEWAVTIRSQAGVERFETFETKKEQQEAFKEAMRQYPEAQGWSVRASVLPDDVKGFAGMPPWFLDRLQTLPGMTPQQMEWIKLLRYQVAPARSFRKHLLPRKRTAGYSRDMERVFARYAFQHARNYGRIKYQRFLEAQIKSLRGEVFQPGHGNVNERSRMANFLADHLQETMNPSADWHMLRSVNSVWYLGMVPSSAALNMTQSIIMTMPFLGSKFGDVKAMKAMTKAGGQISTFYKRGSYEGQSAAHMRMLDFLIKRGDVVESMAAELAGLAAGNALDSYFGFGEKAQRGWLAFADKAMKVFTMVEQWNRRVAARATFDLAMNDPGNEYVQSMKNKYYLQYQKMLNEGFGSTTEILATLAAGDAILKTHYDYSKEARPRFMRGRASLLFAFYMFTQNTVFQLSSRENKGLFIRYALIMTLISGTFGLLPDEGEDVLEFIGKKYFGNDFHLKLETRKFLNKFMSPEWSDLVMHGTGRSSFGIPHLMEALGGPSTPEIDFSRLIELRGIAPLPISPGLDVISGRGVDTEKMISRWTQDIAGAAFGLPFVWAQALGDNELDASDPKRWERAVPRAMGKVMGAWRRYSEEGHRVGRSNMVLEYDTSDPADVAEIVAMGMGFTPTREALNWDVSSAKMEVSLFWKSKRQALLARAYEAKLGKWKNDDMWKDALQAIREYNKETPDPTLTITSKSIQQSFKARLRTQHEFLKGEGPNIPPILGRDVREQFPDTKRVGEQKVKLGFPARSGTSE